MANNCSNWVNFYGEKENLEKLYNDLSRYDNFLNSIQFDEICGISAEDIYGEYGTKWMEIDLLDQDDDYLNLQCDTAWSPALELYRKICIKYNLSCDGEYEEPGCDIAGFFDCTPDGDLNDDCVTYLAYLFKSDYRYAVERLIEYIEYDNYKSFDDIKEKDLLDEEDMIKIKNMFELIKK